MDWCAGHAQECFATRLKALREAAKLTQADLAAKLEVSRGSISYYEKMERVPDIIFLEKTAEYFGVDSSFLLGHTDNEDPRNSYIGNRLNLSDEAIEFFDWNEEFGETLSLMIESKLFNRFWKYCMGYLYEENFRFYRNYNYSGQDGAPAYIVEAGELESYRAFSIANIYIDILKYVREKYDFRNKYGNLTGSELEKVLSEEKDHVQRALDEYDSLIAREREATKGAEEEWLNGLSEEQRLDIERRTLARKEAAKFRGQDRGLDGEQA